LNLTKHNNKTRCFYNCWIVVLTEMITKTRHMNSIEL